MRANSLLKAAGAAALAAAIGIPVAALASHGKVGLWRVIITMHMAGRAMPNIPPAERAKMKQMGISMPNSHTVSTEHCMTQAEVNSDVMHVAEPPQAGCKMINRKMSGHTFTADMVCSGEMKGKGHMIVTYDTPEHYTGKMTFVGTSGGHPANLTDTFDGHWVAADCGDVHH